MRNRADPCWKSSGVPSSAPGIRGSKGDLSSRVSPNVTPSLAKCSAHTRQPDRRVCFSKGRRAAPLTSGSSRVHWLAWRHSVPAARSPGSRTFLLLSVQEKACSDARPATARDPKSVASSFVELKQMDSCHDAEPWDFVNNFPTMILA